MHNLQICYLRETKINLQIQLVFTDKLSHNWRHEAVYSLSAGYSAAHFGAAAGNEAGVGECDIFGE